MDNKKSTKLAPVFPTALEEDDDPSPALPVEGDAMHGDDDVLESREAFERNFKIYMKRRAEYERVGNEPELLDVGELQAMKTRRSRTPKGSSGCMGIVHAFLDLFVSGGSGGASDGKPTESRNGEYQRISRKGRVRWSDEEGKELCEEVDEKEEEGTLRK